MENTFNLLSKNNCYILRTYKLEIFPVTHSLERNFHQAHISGYLASASCLTLNEILAELTFL